MWAVGLVPGASQAACHVSVLGTAPLPQSRTFCHFRLGIPSFAIGCCRPSRLPPTPSIHRGQHHSHSPTHAMPARRGGHGQQDRQGHGGGGVALGDRVPASRCCSKLQPHLLAHGQWPHWQASGGARPSRASRGLPCPHMLWLTHRKILLWKCGGSRVQDWRGRLEVEACLAHPLLGARGDRATATCGAVTMGQSATM